jgi:alkylated DNA repair dioxygenase AlkB
MIGNAAGGTPIQADLFGAPARPRSAAPEGFRYWPRILAPGRSAGLAARLAELPFVPYEFQGYVGNRRVVSFGRRWNPAARAVEPAAPPPGFLAELRDEVAAATGLRAAEFVQVLVNEYPPGAGIGWHRDRPAWGRVLGVSLLAPCTFRLRRRNGEGWDRASPVLEPDSAYLLSGEARRAWEHSITPMAALRYSVTFRTLARPFSRRPHAPAA